ncbi:hypothetical protein HN858_05460 [Candidatus Falkowbacteria bacterium]|jgi:hypothetical protein|nr:hypothetical protein [Candidatus Falkowbacteria bacterium]MBT5502968.1 hypothetical protein [Candidatus Falkowbacteria bacterium]MBT6574324.1 hypothetical protein [Candidatus Falkowbacteria bacterium]MBT7349083.1 hypothetical protein [Candidatus Falkowbacteria bacterium]MBT7500923.1 hypothetical protein [Candidatus Falkowbacteria bacterium]
MSFESMPQSNQEKTGAASPHALDGTKKQVKKFEPDDFEVGLEDFAPGGNRYHDPDVVKEPSSEKEKDYVIRFMEASETKNIMECFFSLKQLYLMHHKAYADLKQDFVGLIDYFLSKEDAEVVGKYRLDLELLKDFVNQNKFDRLPTQTEYLEQLSEFGQAAILKDTEDHFETAQKEVVLNVFEGSLKAGPAQNPYSAYLQVIRAKELGLPESADMKQRFLAFINEELAKDSQDLAKAAKVHLVGLRQRLQEWEEELN